MVKNLRPSTVDSLNKINELIDQVNTLSNINHDSIENAIAQLQKDLQTVQTQISNLSTSDTTNTADITSLKSDMDKVKITLYTPLSSTDATE